MDNTYRHIETRHYNIDAYDDGYSDGKTRYIMFIIQEFTPDNKPLEKKVFYSKRSSENSLNILETILKEEKTVDDIMKRKDRARIDLEKYY